MNNITSCIGIDGCKAGWLGVSRNSCTQELEACIFIQLHPEVIGYNIIGIDIPIGLPEHGSRQCDIDARKKIKPRGSSVFPAPIRPIIGASSYENACKLKQKIDGNKISKQAFFIIPKVAEVDLLLQMYPTLKTSMYEVHPEVSFCCLNDNKPLTSKKKRSEGKQQRTLLIDGVFGLGTCARLKQSLAAYDGWETDDLLDACAAFWTAERIMRGTSTSVSSGTDEVDSTGLPMRIIY